MFVHGELWEAELFIEGEARSPIGAAPVVAGERARVVAVDGMTIKVKKGRGDMMPVYFSYPGSGDHFFGDGDQDTQRV